MPKQRSNKSEPKHIRQTVKAVLITTLSLILSTRIAPFEERAATRKSKE
jgi:hypothetical protein